MEFALRRQLMVHDGYTIHQKDEFSYDEFLSFIKWDIDGGRCYEESWIAYVEDESIEGKCKGQFDFDFVKKALEDLMMSDFDLTLNNMYELEWWKILRSYLNEQTENNLVYRQIIMIQSPTHFGFKEIPLERNQ